MTAAAFRSPSLAADSSLVSLDHLVKHYRMRSNRLFGGQTEVVRAVDGVSLDIRRGETLSLVGETGCGKTTLARCMTRLTDITAGRITFDGRDISRLSQSEMRPIRRRMQIVFQDPHGSLNPRHRVGSIIGEPLAIHNIASGDARRRAVNELMEVVGLNPEHYNRYPHEFSGGQRQRVAIARAIALRPDLIVCDEPVSALDVSIRAQILNLLAALQKDFGLTYLFISHDLSVVRHVSNRVAVMYLGTIVEVAPTADLFAHPRHPYTNALLAAVPIPDPDAAALRDYVQIKGDPPSPINPPSACHFHPRCPKAQPICAVETPLLVPRLHDGVERRAACHFPETS